MHHRVGPGGPRRLVAGVVTGVVAALAAATLAAPSAAATDHDPRTYHVAPDGRDGPGTPRDAGGDAVCPANGADRPFRTLTYALQCLTAGDTLVVHDGTYRERVVISALPGRPEAPVTVRPAAGARPLVEGRLTLAGANHWRVSSLTVRPDGSPYGDNDSMIRMAGGRSWTLSGLDVAGGGGYGQVMIIPWEDDRWPDQQTATDWTITDSCIHDFPDSHSGGGGPLLTDHNVYVAAGDRTSGTIVRNRIFNAANGANVKIGLADGADASDAVEVAYNSLAGSGQNVIVVGDSDDADIHHNLVARGPAPPGKDWYPNIRGIHFHGTGSVVRDNVGTGAARMLLNHTGVTTGLVDGGGNRLAHVPLELACDGLLPATPAAAGVGTHSLEAYAGEPVADLARRISGADRYETAVETARDLHPAAAPTAVVLASGSTYADALAGGPLAAALGAPVLLTRADDLPAAVDRWLAGTPSVRRAVLLGGVGAISARVAAGLRDRGLLVERVAGRDRFATAVAAAEAMDRATPAGAGQGDVVLVEGAHPDPSRGWPDAVAASAWAAQTGRPILLTIADGLPTATRRHLQSREPATVHVVGGAAAVRAPVVEQLRELGWRVVRHAGPSRTATSAAVARESIAAGSSPSRFVLASARSFPDALAAGPAVAAAGQTLLLIHDEAPRSELIAAVEPARLEVTLVGGRAVLADTAITWRLRELTG